MKDVIIPQTNTSLTANGIHRELSYGEFLRWIGDTIPTRNGRELMEK